MKINWTATSTALLAAPLVLAQVLVGCDPNTSKVEAAEPLARGIDKYYDSEFGVACYASTRGISCVQVDEGDFGRKQREAQDTALSSPTYSMPGKGVNATLGF